MNVQPRAFLFRVPAASFGVDVGAPMSSGFDPSYASDPVAAHGLALTIGNTVDPSTGSSYPTIDAYGAVDRNQYILSQFQYAAALAPDGVVGPQTRDAFNYFYFTDKIPPKTAPKPSPAPPLPATPPPVVTSPPAVTPTPSADSSSMPWVLVGLGLLGTAAVMMKKKRAA